MGEFFRVWEIARDKYGLERVVHFDLEEAYMRIYLDGKIIVRVDTSSDDKELLYLQAAKRLLGWMEMRERMKDERRVQDH